MTSAAEIEEAMAILRRTTARPRPIIHIRYEELGPHRSSTPPKRRQRRPSTATLIKQAQKAGLTVTAIKPDGTIVTGKPGEAKLNSGNEWDTVLR